MRVRTVDDFSRALSMFAPYGLIGHTRDGGCLCDQCLRNNEELILSSIKDRNDDGWLVVAIGGGDTDPGIFCDHCGKDVSAYAEEP